MSLLTISGVMAGQIINATFDVNDGIVSITTQGFDHTTWHPGQIGEINTFTGIGSYSGNYNVNEGSYGILNSYINVNANTFGADFVMTDTQNFNIMSGNHNYNVVGNFYAYASGNDNQVAMNLKSVGSMYVWSEATNPYSAPSLRGGYIKKEVWTTENSNPQSDLYLRVLTNGVATMYNSNIWGWTNGEHGSSSTNYGGGTRDVSATGTGTFKQSGFGKDSLTFNGFTFDNGGLATLMGSFDNGFTGTYSMSAN